MNDCIFGEAGSKARTYIPVRHPAHVALLYSALDLVKEIPAGLAGQSLDSRTILAVAFFVRMREFARAASELLLYGQQNAASVQIRAVFEVLVYLKNCCERPEFEAEFIDPTWRDLRQMAQVRVDNPGRFLSEAQREHWVKRKGDFEAEMSNDKRLPSLELLAHKADLEAWYAYFYRMSSHHTHSTFVSLVLSHLELGSPGSQVVNAGPKDTEFRMLSGTLVEFITIASEAMFKLCGLEPSRKFLELRQQHQQLTAKDLANMKPPNTEAPGETRGAT